MSGPEARVRLLAADHRSGAAEIARAAASLVTGMSRDEARDAIHVLVRAHPSMAPLWRLGSAVLTAEDVAGAAGDFLAELDRDGEAAQRLAVVLPDRLLTLSWSSSVRDAIRIRRPERTVCLRSEPGGEGARMAEAISAWTQASVIEDDEAIASVPAQAVMVGADAVGPRTIVNKVKTRALAEAARAADVPCYAVAGGTKFLSEDLPAPEPFERVSLELFTAVAAPDGRLSPAEAGQASLREPLPPGLRRVLQEIRTSSPG
jgi:translation initiation factor 2B subunit (eIF-2B alpha/beta/delta family)